VAGTTSRARVSVTKDIRMSILMDIKVLIFVPRMPSDNTITCTEALSEILVIPDCSIDLVIADIPYNKMVCEKWDNQWASEAEYIAWLDVLFGQFARVMKDGTACYVYCAITRYPSVQLALNRHLVYASTVTWKKQRSRGNGWGFAREEICVNVKGNHLFRKVESQTLMLPHLRSGTLDYSNGRRTLRRRDYKLAACVWDDIPQVCSYRKQLHPTEKPVECARRMLEASSQPHDRVLIPFVGSGSECEACLRMGRSFIGFEIDPLYCQIARDRLASIGP
jgi:site-specific DNA-methyltransferase (adenine-specific)